MLSQRARYALRALVFLARHQGSGPVLIGTIAEAENIPRKFLEVILTELKAASLVQSTRGRSGGYSLACPADAISFGDIVRLTDGPLALVSCVSKTAYQRCADCRDEETCAIRRVMATVRDETARILDGTSLASLLPHG